MASIPSTGSAEWRASPRRRATAIGLTLLAELAFLLLLLGLNPEMIPKAAPGGTPTLIDIGPDQPAVHKEQRKSVARPKTTAAEAPPMPRPVRLPPPPTISQPSPSFIPMSSADMAAADIGKLGSKSGGSAAGSGKAISGPGQGPGGAQLYNAEWVVEPTNAQLSGYLPGPVASGSWAEIACKTIEHFHVENCQPLGESPPGSGLARAMRLSAWQFLVRPERTDKKLLVGSWVRIHISFGDRERDDR